MNKISIIAAVSLASMAFGAILYKKIHDDRLSMPLAQAAANLPSQDSSSSTERSPQVKGMATTLPEFSLQNRDGQMQSIRSWPGKSMIINFWATWCAPCRHEIPLLNELAKTEAKSGYQVVGIAIDFREDVLKYADKIGIDYPLLIGEQEGLAAADAFGVASAGLPFTVFTDKQGRIVTLFVGELNKAKVKVLLDGVARVNRGELSPEAARAVIATQLQAVS